MKIGQLFEKDINRTIKGVVKVEQDDAADVCQELEEYVVTKELNKHFSLFFSNYKKGITGCTDAMGVWISGFFGSGKSHFLKMLSYILGGREYGGKTAIQYFEDKISDSMVLADMKLAADTPTDVILFNIDSRTGISGRNKDSIGYAFLKVFNEMQGFCGDTPLVADLERQLCDKGRYDDFKNRFEEIYGSSWIESRHEFDYIQDEVVETLTDLEIMSEEAARNICEKISEPYSMDVKRFAELVKKYIDKRGKNHHVVFLVDEIGQYIGDNNDLMLNLQTVTENLGTVCHGKAWVIVTSQQDIDSVVNPNRKDDNLITKINQNFSKIQGRFDTRLSLSSSNADEVIKERILKKNGTGRETLCVLFDERGASFKNVIEFKESAEMKYYEDRDDFADVYPFIPYQFNLLSSVLKAVRTYCTSLKHLSDGERSMLALFKESAVRLKDDEPGKIVPLHMFYDALEPYLDHTYSSVITRAYESGKINPGKEENCFNVNVLKTLLLIKYVKDVKPSAENIASLMAGSLDDERIKLIENVRTALNVLAGQMLIQKSGDKYVFLTDEEQEINRLIAQQPVENSDITAEISSMIFQSIYPEDRYRCSHLNGRYSFRFNQMIDDKMRRSNQVCDISVRIITPDSDENKDDATLRISSSQQNAVLVVLPENRTFIDEIRGAKQIEKFLQSGTYGAAKIDIIRPQKQSEAKELNENAKLDLGQALAGAAIYTNGEKVESKAKEIGSRINEALEKLVSARYHKLMYIDTPMDENDVLKLLTAKDAQQILAGTAADPNKYALAEVLDYIGRNTASHTKTSMKTLMDKFKKAPYGFREEDMWWLVAKLFKSGDIFLYVNSENITPHSKEPKEILRYITRKEYLDKLMTEKREKVGERKKKDVKDIIRDVFGIQYTGDDEDAIMRDFTRYAENFQRELSETERRYAGADYPGKQTVLLGERLMREVLAIDNVTEFFNTVPRKQDELLDFADEYEPIKRFFAGEQVKIFDKAAEVLKIFDSGKTYIVDENIESAAKQIRDIVRTEKPYNNIHKLPGLIDEFYTAYIALIDERAKPVRDAVLKARTRVFDHLKDKKCEPELSGRFVDKFEELRRKTESCNDLAVLRGIIDEADTLKVRCLNEIDTREAEILRKAAAVNTREIPGNGDNPTEPPKPVIKKRRNISIRNINTSLSWQLETEADVRKYVSELEEKLMQTLEEGTIVNIEF